jgi:catechol 2,3-dioxygenase-like lactoylglutathione lyase family enzyme
MPVEQLEHYTIRCRDLERTRDFYRDFIGLEVGPRPNFNFAGYWLYCGGVPVLHLVEARGGAGAADGDGHSTGALDHIAFRGLDRDAMVAQFKRHDIAFREASVPDFKLHQVFVHDPDGILIELNFRERPATAS